MTDKPGTMNIYKHVMCATIGESLTLEPEMLILLRWWMEGYAERVDDFIHELKRLNAELNADVRVYEKAVNENADLRADVKRLQERYEFHKYAVSQWLVYEIDTCEEIDELRAENNMLRDTDKAIEFYGYGERLSEAQVENDKLVAENSELRVELKQYKKNMEVLKLLESDLAHVAALEARDEEIEQLRVTVLESAWRAIEEDNSKAIHLEPRQADALIVEHGRLKRHITKLQGEIVDMRTTLDAIGGEGWHEDE